jgi:flagellar hook assembly protein FlgD
MEMFNYPNPFAMDTYFTLKLSGSRAPEEMAIRVFTVAGRKIRELRIPSSSLHVGFNRIHWDGRDEEGDEVANGYYFYQATMKGEGNVQSEIRKLVKVK